MLAFLSCALRVINPLKVGFVFSHLLSDALNAAVYQEFLPRMTALGRQADIVMYDAVTATLDKNSYDTFRALLKKSTRSCIFLLTPSSTNISVAFEALIADNDINATVLIPCWLMGSVITSYTKLDSNKQSNLKSP